MKKKIKACIFVLFAFCLLILVGAGSKPPTSESNVIDIGSRLELFVDDYLIEKMDGKTKLRLHNPVPQEVAFFHDAPWEGTTCVYHSVFKDDVRSIDGVYRIYYRGSGRQEGRPSRTEVYCYAESEDGIHWRKPNLGIRDFFGEKDNNIVFDFYLHTASIFKDNNPNASPDARYKAMVFVPAAWATGHEPKGLEAFRSKDGIHWSPMNDTKVITDGAFDSQNNAFWDSYRGEYRAYWRGGGYGVRGIRTATSKDFINWSNQDDVIYEDGIPQHLYANQIFPYYRAPHIFIGFPSRYLDRYWSESMRMLPEREDREMRYLSGERVGTALTEGLFMTSRDGVTFNRWNEAFLRPGIEREGTWNYGQNYVAWGLVETKSALDGEAPNELSLYATESYSHSRASTRSSALRRYTIRMDGFVSVNAPMSGGELITKPLTFTGSQLVLNFSSSAAGGIQVEIQDATGRPLPGFALDDCPPVFGDTIERKVTWNKGSDLSMLEGKPVRLRFVIKDADLFSLRFK